jgi:hypothetical protein
VSTQGETFDDEMNSRQSIADLLGQWVDPDWKSGLIQRCKNAWNKPLKELSNEEIATLLRQKIAVAHLLPIAHDRVKRNVDDGSEIYDGELEAAIEGTQRGIEPEYPPVIYVTRNDNKGNTP